MALPASLINGQTYCYSLSNAKTLHKWFLCTLFPSLKFISKAPKPKTVKKSSRRVILSVVRFPYEHPSYIVKLFNLLFACQFVKHCWEWGKKKSRKARILVLYTQFQGNTLNDKMLQKERKKISLKSQCHKNRDRFCSPNIIHWHSCHYMKLRLGLGVWPLLWRLYFRSSILNS